MRFTSWEEKLFEDRVDVGVNEYRIFHQQCQVTGTHRNEYPPIKTFEHECIDDVTKEVLRRSGYDKPTPIQANAIPIVYSGRDIMACAPTGSGKSAAFLVPIIKSVLETEPLHLEGPSFPLVLIVLPTRELAEQLYDQARKFSAGTPLRGTIGLSTGGMKRKSFSVDTVEGSFKRKFHDITILVSTPGKLMDIIRRNHVDLSRIKTFVLDEADRMLSMGFKKDIDKIGAQLPDDCQKCMFSATFPPKVQLLARKMLDKHVLVAVGKIGGANDDITQHFIKLENESEKTGLLKEIVKGSRFQDSKILVFVERKAQSTPLAAALIDEGHEVDTLQGDKDQNVRSGILRQFKEGDLRILIATSVAARGLDISGVDLVINYDLPEMGRQGASIYVQRIGRTGRMGNKGTAISFYISKRDRPLAHNLTKILSDVKQEVPDWLAKEAGVKFSKNAAPETQNRMGVLDGEEEAWNIVSLAITDD